MRSIALLSATIIALAGAACGNTGGRGSAPGDTGVAPDTHVVETYSVLPDSPLIVPSDTIYVAPEADVEWNPLFSNGPAGGVDANDPCNSSAIFSVGYDVPGMYAACETTPDSGVLLTNKSLASYYVIYNGVLWQEICTGDINSDYANATWAPPGTTYNGPDWQQVQVCDDAASSD